MTNEDKPGQEPVPEDIREQMQRMQDPVWKARAQELEDAVHVAAAALLAHTAGISALSIPKVNEQGEMCAVFIGDPVSIFAAIEGEGPTVLVRKNAIVGKVNPGEMIMKLLSQMMQEASRGRMVPEDNRCNDPECEACIKTH